MAVGAINGAQHTTGVAGCDDIVGDIAGHDRTGADDRPVANRDAGQKDAATPDPDVVADRNRLAVLGSGGSSHRVERMGVGVDLDTRSKEDLIANRDRADIEDDTAEVGIEILPDPDVISVIATEGGFDPKIAAGFSKKISKSLDAQRLILL